MPEFFGRLCRVVNLGLSAESHPETWYVDVGYVSTSGTMYLWRHRVLPLLVLVALATLAVDARAWVETAIRSDYVRLELERDGSAVVSHEMMMRVRGGPLEGFVLEGIDGDAEPLSDAIVVRVVEGRAPTPLPVLLDVRDDGALALEVDHKKGISRGTYLWRFRYRTNLLERGMIEPNGEQADVRWIGPRYADGIDSVKVVVSVPTAPNPPVLPRFDLGQAELGLDEDPGGIFLSTLRRAADKDELEIVRPHVAKGEPVVWQLVADLSAFDELAPPEPVAPVATPNVVQQLPVEQRPFLIAAAIAVVLIYALLVVLKWRALIVGGERRRARPRALIPLPAGLRGVLSGLLLVGAAVVALVAELPTVAGGMLVASMALAAHIGPRALPSLRGPGRWRTVSDEEAFERRAEALPGGWLDAGTVFGFALFALLLGAFAASALVVLSASPYQALLIALSGAAVVPIFCTGRTSELPADPATRPRRFLRRVARRLRKSQLGKVVPLLRFPIGAEQPDELRLLVMPRPAVPGLIAIEVGVEYQLGGGGPVAFPVVLVRTLEDSPAQQRLERVAEWSRGRRAEERVAVIRPKLPTQAFTVSLAQRLSNMLTDTRRRVRRSHQPRIKTPIPSGRAASTSKAGTAASPAHAT